MSMGNLLTLKPLSRTEMATDRTDAPLDGFRATTDSSGPDVPGIDHLTVVPANANPDE